MPSYNNFGNEFGGFILCIMSFVKVVVITLAFVSAAALAWSVPAAFAKAIKPETAARCLRGREEAVNTGTICSFQCNAQTNWCAQQFCNNGTLVQVLPCSVRSAWRNVRAERCFLGRSVVAGWPRKRGLPCARQTRNRTAEQ